MPREEKTRLLNQCLTWLKKSTFEFKVSDKPKGFSEIIVTRPGKIDIHIIQLNDETDAIGITSRIELLQDLQSILAGWQQVQKAEFINKLAIMLLQKGIQYYFQNEDLILKSMTLEKEIFGEGLKKQVFFDTIRSVHEANLMMRIELSKIAGPATATVATETSNEKDKTLPYG